MGRLTRRHTNLSAKAFIFEWKIENFDEIPYKKAHPMYSVPFSFKGTTDGIWQLMVTKDIKNVTPIEVDGELIYVFPEVASYNDIDLKTNVAEPEKTHTMHSSPCSKAIDASKCTTPPNLKIPSPDSKFYSVSGDKELETCVNTVPISPSRYPMEHSKSERVVASDLKLLVEKSEMAIKSVEESVKEKCQKLESQMNISNSLNEGVSLEQEISTAVLGFRLSKISSGSTWEEVESYKVTVEAGPHLVEAKIAEIGLQSRNNRMFLFKYIIQADNNEAIFEQKDITVKMTMIYKSMEKDPFFPLELAEDQNITSVCLKTFKEKKHCDIILKCGEKLIPTSKSILCARSFFFDNELQDRTDNRTRIEMNVDLFVASAILSFIYGGGIPRDFPADKCHQLCEAAKEYEIQNLDKVSYEIFRESPTVCGICLDKFPKKENVDYLEFLKDASRVALLATCEHATVCA